MWVARTCVGSRKRPDCPRDRNSPRAEPPQLAPNCPPLSMERLGSEHVVSEAFVKAAQVILGARLLQQASPQPTSPARDAAKKDRRSGRWVRPWGSSWQAGTASENASSTQPCQPAPAARSSAIGRPCASLAHLQFNLELEEVEGVGRELENWRKDPSLPMVIEVRAERRGPAPAWASPTVGQHTSATSIMVVVRTLPVSVSPPLRSTYDKPPATQLVRPQAALQVLPQPSRPHQCAKTNPLNISCLLRRPLPDARGALDPGLHADRLRQCRGRLRRCLLTGQQQHLWSTQLCG